MVDRVEVEVVDDQPGAAERPGDRGLDGRGDVELREVRRLEPRQLRQLECLRTLSRGAPPFGGREVSLTAHSLLGVGSIVVNGVLECLFCRCDDALGSLGGFLGLLGGLWIGSGDVLVLGGCEELSLDLAGSMDGRKLGLRVAASGCDRGSHRVHREGGGVLGGPTGLDLQRRRERLARSGEPVGQRR